jgi:methionyl-tRNA formyltransferase
MKNVIFLGSKPIGYNCLNFLIKNKNKLNIKIKGVLSNDNTRFDEALSIKTLASINDIVFFEKLNDILVLNDIDFILSVQYHLILKRNHIDVAKDLAVNLHMAPLPEYRGCNQFSFAIYNKNKIFGTTLHRLETGIDNGAIIAEKRFEILPSDDVESLYTKTFDYSISLFKSEIGKIIKGEYSLTEQDTFIGERDTNIYYRKDINELKKINLNDSSEKIVRTVKATAMRGFEPPYAIVDGEKFYIIPEKMYTKQKG